MIEIFNAVSNIAKEIEQQIFINCDDFLDNSLDTQAMHTKVFAHCSKIIEREFEYVKSIKGVIGKDKKQLCTINPNGKYLVSCVAIDNIDLLDVDFSLGTIFGIYEERFEAKDLKAAIYITYGPTFQLVFANDTEGVQFFIGTQGELIQQSSFRLNEQGKINSTGGLVNEWGQTHKDLMQSFFDNGYRLRFSDSLTLDMHQIIFKKGGIYSSPTTKSNPDGTLEVIFEAFPIAYIIELVGGEAIDGKSRILDIISPSLHQKTPIYFGSSYEISKVKESYCK